MKQIFDQSKSGKSIFLNDQQYPVSSKYTFTNTKSLGCTESLSDSHFIVNYGKIHRDKDPDIKNIAAIVQIYANSGKVFWARFCAVQPMPMHIIPDHQRNLHHQSHQHLHSILDSTSHRMNIKQ